MLSVRNLGFAYGGRVALEGLCLDVLPGECVGLLGPNGAGKTTAFGILAGFARPTSGKILLDGREVPPGSAALRASIGVVFQKPSLDGKLTARENLELGGELFGLSRAERAERAAELLRWSELEERGRERVERLSEGMKRRLELARALVHRPRILLMDEPSQGLDEGAYQRLWAHLRELRSRDRLSILLATHRADEAEGCDRLVVLDRGRPVASGSPESLRACAGHDRIEVCAARAEELVRPISELLGVQARARGREVSFEAAGAHQLVPRLVEALPRGRVESVRVRRPTLADAFLRITGASLEGR